METMPERQVFNGEIEMQMRYSIYKVAKKLKDETPLPPAIWLCLQMLFNKDISIEDKLELAEVLKDTGYSYKDEKLYYYGMRIPVISRAV